MPNTSVPPTASNTVLFQMAMHYKQQAEAAVREHTNAMSALRNEIMHTRNLTDVNRDLTLANRRGADLITMKHQAGEMFLDITDQLAVLLSNMRRAIPETQQFAPEIERLLLRADFASHLLYGQNFVDLTAETDEEEESDTEVTL